MKSRILNKLPVIKIISTHIWVKIWVNLCVYKENPSTSFWEILYLQIESVIIPGWIWFGQKSKYLQFPIFQCIILPEYIFRQHFFYVKILSSLNSAHTQHKLKKVLIYSWQSLKRKRGHFWAYITQTTKVDILTIFSQGVLNTRPADRKRPASSDFTARVTFKIQKVLNISTKYCFFI